MSCKECLPLGPLDPKTVAALVRIMGTPQYAALITGVDLPPPLHQDGSVDTAKLVAREMGRLRGLVSSGDFIQAVLAVLSLEHGDLRIDIRSAAQGRAQGRQARTQASLDGAWLNRLEVD